MVGKQIFWDRSVEVDAKKVIDEIAIFIENQNKNKELNPEFFDSVLLFISELLPQARNSEQWIELGYEICKSFKRDMEGYGYKRHSSMFSGLGYRCFAVNTFSQEANILQGFSKSINKVLFATVKNRVSEIKKAPMRSSDYDVISGISGLLYYLLDYDYTQEEEAILFECIQYLLSLTQDVEFQGKPVIRFHVLQPNQNPNFDQEDFRNGSIDFGLAHGILGPLISLSKAYAKGLIVDGLKEGIEKIYHLYEIYQSNNEYGIPYWPGKITVEEYWESKGRKEHVHSACSWCYGNFGTIRGLQKISGYMGWAEREQTYIEAMKCLLAQDIKFYNLFTPSLCHGFSSMVAIQTCAYASYRDPKLLTNLERNVREVISGYRRNNEQEVSLVDIAEQRIWLEGYLKDLSFLTGATGIATTLLFLQGSMKAGKLLMID